MRIYLFQPLPPPLEFFIFLLYPWKFQAKQSSTPGNPQIFLTSLGNSKVKNQETKTPGNSTNFSLVALGNSTSFLINPWKFHMLFVWYHCKFHILNPPAPSPPCLFFFWNSPMCTDPRNLQIIKRGNYS